MMRVALFVAFVLFSATAFAQQMVARDQVGNVVTLHDKQCTTTPWLKDWKTATFFYEGKAYAACWRVLGSNVVILDAAGEVTGVPVNAFNKESGV